MAWFDAMAGRFRRTLIVDRVEPDLEAGVRMVVVVVVPLALALIADRVDVAVLAALGALNVGLADPGGSVRVRATTTITASVVMTIAIALSTLVAGTPWVAICLVAVWTLVLSLVGSIDEAAAGVAFVGSIVFIVGLGLPDDPSEIGLRVVSFALGCAWAVLMTALVWPLHRDTTVRRELARAFRLMARFVRDAPHDEVQRSTGRDEVAVALASARREVTHRSAVSNRTETVALFYAADVVERSLGAIDRALASTSSPIPAELSAAAAAVASTCEDVADAIEVRGRWNADELSMAVERVDGVTLDGDLAIARDALKMVDRGLAERSTMAVTATASPAVGTSGRLRRVANPDSIVFRHAVRLAVLVGIAQALAFVDPFEKGYWIPLTVVVVLKPDLGSTLDRAAQRTTGTIVGALIAFAAISAADGRTWLLATVFGACVFWMASFLDTNYTLGVAGLTPSVILLLAIDGGGTGLVLDRIGSTLVGGVLAALGALLLWPLWARRTLTDELRAAASAAKNYLDDAVEGVAESTAVQRAHRRAELARSDADALRRRMLSEPRRDRIAPVDVAEFCNGLRALIESTTQLRATHLRHGYSNDAGATPPTVALEDALEPANRRLQLVVEDTFGGGIVRPGPSRASESVSDDIAVGDTYQLIVTRIDAQTRSTLRSAQRIAEQLPRSRSTDGPKASRLG